MATPKIVTQYKPVVRTKNNDGFSACALVGIHSLLLGWNMDESIDRTEFMGFAVNRSEYDPNTKELLRKFWMNGKKRFKGSVGDVGLDVRSDQGPFQRFRWSDYTVHPSRSYTYEIIPMFGKAHNLKRGKSLFLNLRPSPETVNDLSIISNRGVTAAFAYLERFGNIKPEDVPDNAAKIWLSRGLKESVINYIGKTKRNDGLKIAIYEFHDVDVAQALEAAKNRGVKLDIVYDAGKASSQTKNEHLLTAHNLMDVATARFNVAISHNKFMIHLERNKPVSVWTGSSNFSTNAFYKQTNQAVIINRKDVAESYNEYHAIIKSDPERSQHRFKEESSQFLIGELNKRNLLSVSDMEINFSPTNKVHVIDQAIEAIRNAKSAILVSSPFSLDKVIINELVNNENVIIEYGLVNTTAKNKVSMLKNRNSRFVHPSRLETYMGKAWDARAFGAHKIHSKTIVIDPWSNNPTSIFGSANFSTNSSKSNDENLFITNNKRFAATISCEFLRMYDHYRSRFFINKSFSGSRGIMYLEEDGNKWTKTSFDAHSNSFKFRDRLVFSGMK